MEFRIMMDELYLQIINSADIPSAKSKIIDKINYNINTLNRVMSESKIKRLIGSVKAELNISDLFLASLTGISLREGLSIPIETAALLGITASAIKVSIQAVPKLNSLPDSLKAYAYLYYAERELI